MNFEDWQKRITKSTKWEGLALYTLEKANIIDTKCSVCHHISSIVLPEGFYYVYDYCPFCGEYMMNWKDYSTIQK